MSPDTKKHVTLTGIVAILGTVGSLLYVGIEKAAELDKKLANSDGYFLKLDKRVSRLERREGIKPSANELQTRPEGLARRVLHLIW